MPTRRIRFRTDSWVSTRPTPCSLTTCFPQLSVTDARKYIDEGTIRAGMIPKVECCIDVLANGVPSAHVIDGRTVHAILLEIFTDGGVGTLITH